MRALVDELDRERRATWPRWLGLAAVLVAGAVAVVAVTRPRAPVCAGAEQHWIGVWDPGHKAALAGRFAAVGAATAWPEVEHGLDGYTSSWSDMRTQACVATRVHGEQSEKVMDLRLACLDDRLGEVAALVGQLDRLDAQVARKAAAATAALAPLATCANTVALENKKPAPTGPALTAVAGETAQANALRIVGRYTEALVVANAAVLAGLALGYEPALADALVTQAAVQGVLHQVDEAHASLHRAAVAALAGRHDARLAEAFLQLATVSGSLQERPAEAHQWLSLAEAAIARAGGSDALESDLAYARMVLLRVEGRWAELEAAAGRSLALAERVHGGHDYLGRIAGSLNALALAQKHLGREDEAIVTFARAFAALAPENVRNRLGVADNLNGALFQRARFVEALGIAEHFLPVSRSVLGPTHPATLQLLMSSGYSLCWLGHCPEAASRFEEILAAPDKNVDTDLRKLSLAMLARSRLDAGRPADALALLERRARLLPLDEDDLTIRGEAELALGRQREARVDFAHVLGLLAGATHVRERVWRARVKLDLARLATPNEARALAARAAEDVMIRGEQPDVMAWLGAPVRAQAAALLRQ
jgi:tetratricopeptide (TPR) repeat protein